MRKVLLLFAACFSVSSLTGTGFAEEPNLAVIPAPRDNFWCFNRYLSLKEQAAKSSPDVVFLGDSITEQWGSNGKKVWEEKFAPLKAFNAGIGGDRTEHILWRIQNGGLDFKSAPKVCVLMIGTNNTGHKKGQEVPEHTAQGIEDIVKALHAKYPKMKILLLGILPRGADKQDALRIQNEKINAIVSNFKQPYVTYLDITSAFTDEDGNLSRDISPDLLHFKPEGYVLYADAILPSINKLLK